MRVSHRSKKPEEPALELPDLDLELLKTFVEVARRGSVQEAARALGRSQPAISRRVTRLEEVLGSRLFEKAGRGIRPTGTGRVLAERCAELFASVRRIADEVRAESGSEARGTVVLGTLPTLAAHFLMPMLADVLDRHPAVRLSLELEHEDVLLSRLAAGSIDLLVLIGQPDVFEHQATVLTRDRLVAVLPRSRAPRGRKPLSAKDLAGMRYLSWEGPRDTTFMLAQTWARSEGLVSASTPRIPHIETLRRLVAKGAGFTILPRYTTTADVAEHKLAVFDLEGLSTPLPISMVERAASARARPAEIVREAILGLRERRRNA